MAERYHRFSRQASEFKQDPSGKQAIQAMKALVEAEERGFRYTEI